MALKEQLATLEAQREQLALLLGDDSAEGSILQLQGELDVAISGIRRRLKEPAAAPQESPLRGNEVGLRAGHSCLAPRVFDRRRAAAVVEEVYAYKRAYLVTWIHPRHKREIVCRYWKELFTPGTRRPPSPRARRHEKGRSCKYSGPDCPFSHGVEVPVADVVPDTHGWRAHAADSSGGRTGPPSPASEEKTDGRSREGHISAGKAIPAERWLSELRAGSGVLARYEDRVWYEATVEGGAINGHLSVRFKGFERDGAVLIPASLTHVAPLEYDEAGGVRDSRGRAGGSSPTEVASEVASISVGRADSDLEDAWADVPIGSDEDGDAFFQERVLGGVGREGIVGGKPRASPSIDQAEDGYWVGDWEQHTKGFGSRMMSRMGYRRGEGLGKEKQGMARPVDIRVLPERRALDHLRVDDGSGRRGIRQGVAKQSRSRSSGTAPPADSEPQKAMFDFVNVTIHASVRDKRSATASSTATTVGAGRGRSASAKFAVASPAALPFSSSSGSAAGGRSAGTAGAGAGWKNDTGSSATTEEATGGSGGVGGSTPGKRRAADMSRSELRSHLVAAQEAESALAAKAVRLEETIKRNAERDPRTASAARRKLVEVQAQAREARASRDQVERVLGHRGDKGKGKSKGSSGKKGSLFSF